MVVKDKLHPSVFCCLTAPPDTAASQAFQVAAPKLQKNLPSFVKSSRSYDVLKRRLKSHLFAQVFT